MNARLESLIKWPVAGHYVVALSGGADSASLVHLFAAAAEEKGYELEIAHFNHGWPGDDEYERVAREAMERYGLPLHVGKGETERNEAAARQARYRFLRQVVSDSGARAIITAHHLDDLEETVVLNLLRGTGRRGLSPFGARDVLRPLVGLRKAELLEYVKEHNLLWCHDSYNDDLHFERNRIRHELLPQLRRDNVNFDEQLSQVIDRAGELNRRINKLHDEYLQQCCKKTPYSCELPLSKLRQMDPATLQDLIVYVANQLCPGIELDSRAVEALAIDLKTGRFKRLRHLTGALSVKPVRGTVEVVFSP